MAKHYFEDLNEILGGDDFQQQSKKYIEQKEKDSVYYGYPYELTPFEADVGTVIYKRKMKLQPKSQPQQPVKQMKKPKKGKGIVKVIAGVGAVVLCAAGIIYAFNNIDKIREELKKNSDAIPPSSFSYGIPDNHDDDYSYDDEQDKGFTR